MSGKSSVWRCDSDDYSSLFEIGVKLYSQYRNLEGFPAEKKFVP